MEEYQKSLQRAIKHLQIADHMTYVTFPLINENRLLLKIFDEIYLTIIYCINTILNYEILFKRIKIQNSNNEYLQIFEKIAKNYNISSEQIKIINNIISLNKKHKQSAMEFVKKEKIIILSDNLNTKIIDITLVKHFLLIAKELLMKVSKKINPSLSS